LRIFFFGALLRLMLRPPVTIPKNSARCMGGIFSDGTPVLGRGAPGCGGRRGTEWHSRMRKSALQAGYHWSGRKL